MKSIGVDTLFLSVLILLTANRVNGEDGDQAATLQPTSSGVLSTISGVSSSIPANTTTKTENSITPTASPVFPTTRLSVSYVTKTNDVTQDPTVNGTKNGTEPTTKVNNITDEHHPANYSSTTLSNVNLTILTSTHATLSYREIKPTDGKTEHNPTDSQNHVLESPEVTSDKTTEHTEVQPTPRSKKGVIIGVVCVLASVVFVVLIFLYKMCQKKPPATENSEVKVSAQTKESVKLLSVKTASPYSDSKRISSNHMESIEC